MPDDEGFLPKPSELYTEQDIRRWFDDRTLGRAASYGEAISHLTILPELLMAEVQGTEPEPYFVTIDIHRPTPRSITIEAECSCPVGFNCKHAAAVLYAALRLRGHGPRANPVVMSWIEHLANGHRLPPLPPQAPTPSGEAIHYLLEPHQPPHLYHLTLFKGELSEPSLKRTLPAWRGMETALKRPPRCVQKSDLAIFRALLELDQPLFEPDTYIIDRTMESPILEAIVASGRAWLKEQPKGRGRARAEIPLVPLTLGPARSAQLEWQRDEYGYYLATLLADENSWIVPSHEQLYYLDHVSGRVGRIGDGEAEQLLSHLLQLPPLDTIDAQLVAAALAPLAP
ncbi:MAG TPA: SWIM zinc finger family protein, partial [Gammaproteobacteria bacterium]